MLERLLTVTVPLDISMNQPEACESQVDDLNKEVALWILKLKEGRKLTHMVKFFRCYRVKDQNCVSSSSRIMGCTCAFSV